jgi:transposase
MNRYDLSDPQWARIAPLFPRRARPGIVGRPPGDHRPIVNAILWVLHTGAPWRDLPECDGPWQTVFTRFNGWRRDGTWVRIVTSLLDELDDKGLIDRDLWCIDGTVIRASRAAAGARKRGRATRSGWAGARGRECRSLQTMRWGVREADSGRRSTWSVTAMASSWPSTSRPGRRTRARDSSRRWPGNCSPAVVAKAAGRTTWRETRGIATLASADGVAGDGSGRSSRLARTSRARRASTRRGIGVEISSSG